MIYDNRSRIRVRIEQLLTGRRHTQTPRSALARLISNIEIVDVAGQEVTALANVLIYGDNLRGETHWAARNEVPAQAGRWRLPPGAPEVTPGQWRKPSLPCRFLV